MRADTSITFALVNYRLYKPGDFAQLYAIEESCFEPVLRFPRTYMRELVNSPRGASWVAEEQGKLAGFAIVEWLMQSTTRVAYIETIEVDGAWRRQGVGRELLTRVEKSARIAGAESLWLHVDVENASAIRLYESHGYLQKGREEGYYARRRAALVYCKVLFNE